MAEIVTLTINPAIDIFVNVSRVERPANYAARRPSAILAAAESTWRASRTAWAAT